MRQRWWWLVVLLVAPVGAAGQDPAPDSARVRAILFYSPTCPHCQDVITQGLPPILDRFGDRLQIAGVNTATPGGEQLFRAAIEDLAIPPERVGVPTLVVGSAVLVGSLEIPQQLPGIVETALQSDGIDWPEVPLIRQALAAQGIAGAEDAESAETAETAETAESAETARGVVDSVAAGEVGDSSVVATPGGSGVGAGEAPSGGEEAGSGGDEDGGGAEAAVSGGEAATVDEGLDLTGVIDPDARAALVHQLSMRQRLMLDPAGNGTAIAVLVLMLAALGLVGAEVLTGRIRIPAAPGWALPVLALAGSGVAAYLAFVEITGTEAVCGPVGDCNTVQQSPFARILGVPVGVLGVLGYAGILTAWGAGRLAATSVREFADRTVWWLALAATLFSIYLTSLEPFVIGATCAWCLTSAVVATLLLLVATPARRQARDAVGVSPTQRPSVSH